MFRRTHVLSAGVALLAAGVLAAGCSSNSASPGGSGSGAPVTIKIVLPPNTGPITAADNAGLKQLTTQYEAAHKNVTVQWLPNNTGSISAANAAVESQASGGAAPDVVLGTVRAGDVRRAAGLLQNIKPYLTKPNPYVPGNSSWLSLFTPVTVPYMTSSNGDIDIILGSNVETGFFYSKAAFAKAGITSPPATWADLMTDLGKLKSVGITPFMFTDGNANCTPSWWERLATTSMLASQVSQFDVNHAQVTNGLDVAVGIHKGIISMSNPRYAEAWKLLGQLVSYSASGESSYDGCADPNATSPPLSPQSLLIQGKVGVLWGGSWWIPQLGSAGFTGKFGVFPEPPITTASSPLALGTSTVGVIGGPNGNGQWSITSQRADSTMTPAKTATVMNFMAWLFTPQHLGYWLKISGNGAYIPTETGAPTVNLPGLNNLVPTSTVPTVIDVVLDNVLSTVATNSGSRLFQEYVNGSLSYSAFASQWQSLLTSAAQQWATQNHVDLNKY